MDCQAETNVVRIRNTLTAEASRLASAHLVMGTAGPSCSVCVLGVGRVAVPSCHERAPIPSSGAAVASLLNLLLRGLVERDNF